MTSRARPSAMTAAFTIVVLFTLVLAAVVVAQPPTGIVRPTNEARLSQQQLGSQLYAGNCAGCHGIDGRGVAPPQMPQRGPGDIKGQGPPLRGVGALAADFYLRTGYMPLGKVGEQPQRSRVLFTDREIRAMVAYVASLAGGPPVPTVHPAQGSLSEGLGLFTQHCAGCHQAVAQGGFVTGARVPPLQNATATQVAQAVRIGPYLMPSFSSRDISDRQLNSLVRYVLWTRHPSNEGGWAIGNIGPVPEGMVAWFVAVVVLAGGCVLIGRRLRG
jgi:ubiquinol-cytochrome c reductase cytochrome c subunit